MSYTASDIIGFAQQFLPVFKFSRGPGGENEPFYPVDAEGWITHQANASVTQSATGPTSLFRGTAMYRWHAADFAEPPENWRAQLPEVLAGQLKLDASNSGIGDPRFAARPLRNPADPQSGPSDGDWYLDFGGWSDEAARANGQMRYSWREYTAGVFTPLGLPTSSEPAEPAPGPDPNAAPPATFTPDGRALHTYAEFGGLRGILEQLVAQPLSGDLAWMEQGRTALQGGADQLAEYLGLTYYLFYPGSIPTSLRLLEGQWEAVSVFLQDQGGGALRADFASYSQGWDGGMFPTPRAACKKIGDMETVAAHPVAYVAWGSHVNYFTPRASEVNNSNAGVNTGVAVASGVGGVLLAAGVTCIIIGALATPVGWVLVVVGIVLVVLAAIAFIIAAILGSNDQKDPPPPWDQSPPEESQPHGGDGTTAGGSTSSTPASPPAAGDPTGFMVHPITAIPAITDPEVAPPSWWSFVGRWGVCVDDASALRPGPTWSNGVWRRWPEGYSLTHRNAEALLDYLHDEIDRQTKTSSTYGKDNR